MVLCVLCGKFFNLVNPVNPVKKCFWFWVVRLARRWRLGLLLIVFVGFRCIVIAATFGMLILELLVSAGKSSRLLLLFLLLFLRPLCPTIFLGEPPEQETL